MVKWKYPFVFFLTGMCQNVCQCIFGWHDQFFLADWYITKKSEEYNALCFCYIGVVMQRCCRGQKGQACLISAPVVMFMKSLLMQLCSESVPSQCINMRRARCCLFSFYELVQPKKVAQRTPYFVHISPVLTEYAVLEHMFAVQKLVDGAEDFQWGELVILEELRSLAMRGFPIQHRTTIYRIRKISGRCIYSQPLSTWYHSVDFKLSWLNVLHLHCCFPARKGVG